MIEAGEYSTVSHGQDLLERHEAALAAMVGTGASRNPRVPITRMTEEDRQARVTAMPNIAKAWAEGLEAQGLPAADFMHAQIGRAPRPGRSAPAQPGRRAWRP